MDAYYRSNPPLIVTKDPDAICRKRPQKYIDHEASVIEKTVAGLNYPSDGTVSHVEQLEAEADKE